MTIAEMTPDAFRGLVRRAVTEMVTDDEWEFLWHDVTIVALRKQELIIYAEEIRREIIRIDRQRKLQKQMLFASVQKTKMVERQALIEEARHTKKIESREQLLARVEQQKAELKNWLTQAYSQTHHVPSYATAYRKGFRHGAGYLNALVQNGYTIEEAYQQCYTYMQGDLLEWVHTYAEGQPVPPPPFYNVSNEAEQEDEDV